MDINIIHPPMMLVGEEEEIFQWCKDMVECGHKLEMIQLIAHIPPSMPMEDK